MTGRTVAKHARFYMGGYDLSGYARTFGPLVWTYDEQGEAALSDEIKNYLPGHPTVSVGQLNGFFDNTATSGLHVVASAAGVIRTVMAPIGMRAAPAAGDPVWGGQYTQLGYQSTGEGLVGVNIPFGGWDNSGTTEAYDQPWGVLLHAKGAETAASTTTGAGIDTAGGQTTKGGYMIYQVFTGTGAVTISIDDSSDDSSYGALTDATIAIADASTPQAGIVALGKTDTVEQYLRWQIAAGGGFSTVTFALAFVRGR